MDWKVVENKKCCLGSKKEKDVVETNCIINTIYHGYSIFLFCQSVELVYVFSTTVDYSHAILISCNQLKIQPIGNSRLSSHLERRMSRFLKKPPAVHRQCP